MSTPRYQWQPTTAEIALRYGLLPDQVVRFDPNTSPFATDWASGIVAPMARHLNEYPGASYADLRRAAGAHFDVDPTTIVPGAGADEMILLVARAFLGEGRRACAAIPTYPLYEIATLQAGAEFRAIELETPDFGFPLRALGEAAETSDVTWLCVPNNPTGHRISNADIEAIVATARGLVVIDAAYAEFSGDRWGEWIANHDNIIVLHTMSKGFGLAALRVGFAMTQPDIADQLDAVRPPGSISSMSADLAQEALASPQRMERHVSMIRGERDRLAAGLRGLEISVVPGTATNFLLCEIGPEAGQLAESLMHDGLVIRQFPPNHSLNQFVRFTVRSRQQNDRLIDALRSRLT
ncbi:MAG: pyridoxal phosphate-dependent aminotransferase [Acidimicrobiia bacterium]